MSPPSPEVVPMSFPLLEGEKFSAGEEEALGSWGRETFPIVVSNPPLSPPLNLFPLPLFLLAGTTLVLYPVPDVFSLVEMDLLVNLGMVITDHIPSLYKFPTLLPALFLRQLVGCAFQLLFAKVNQSFLFLALGLYSSVW